MGRFLKFPVTNFLSKVAKMFGDLLGYFERHHFLGKTAVDTFWATFGKNWATLNSNILSNLTGTNVKVQTHIRLVSQNVAQNLRRCRCRQKRF